MTVILFLMQLTYSKLS